MIKSAQQERIPRTVDGNLARELGHIVSVSNVYPAFILREPNGSGDPRDLHARRVAAAQQWMSERFGLDNYTPTAEFGDVQTPGLHFDHMNFFNWSLNVHTTLEGGGLVRMARHNTEYPSLSRVRGAYTDAKRRLSTGWPDVVDTDIVEPVVWGAELAAGDTVFFPINNFGSAEHPIGVWHEFTTSDTMGRLAVAETISVTRES